MVMRFDFELKENGNVAMIDVKDELVDEDEVITQFAKLQAIQF